MKFEIKTERLFLMPPKISDADELFNLMSDERLSRFLTWEAHRDIETSRDLIQNLIESQCNDRAYHWCVWLNEKIIGLISLIDVKRKIRTWTLNRAELSYWIGLPFQKHGYATEAGSSIIEFGFSQLHLHKIIVAHANENVESKSICKKLNFVPYGNEHDAFFKDGKWYDLIWYELIKHSR